MRAFARLRDRMRPAVMVAVLALVFATAGAAIGASLHLPSIITPISEGQVTNLDILRLELKNYYGTPGAASGSGASAGWTLPLNTDSNYAKEAEKVAAQGMQWLSASANLNNPNRAIVLDVDDTTLTTWNYELFSNWDFNPGTNAVFVGTDLSGTPWTGNLFPATPGMVDMVNWAKENGYAVFWITGRGDSQHEETIANLVNDAAAGLPDLNVVTYSGATLPEMDAGYLMPTPAAIGHGGFTDGLFTKPPVGQYPSYLDKPEFCGPAITAGKSCATIQYKSGTRAYIESLGYEIVADFGDQFSDLLGGFADNTFKMPNPNYYLP